MFETVAPEASAPVLRSWLSRLGEPGVTDDDSDLIAEIELLEQVKAACAARQARLSVAFDEAHRTAQQARGVPARAAGRGVAEQVALARRDSPTNGSRHLGLARALVREMPNTLAALSVGEISEWMATVVVRETACLAAEDRGRVDAELGSRLTTLSPAQARREAWATACRLDPHAAVARHRKAVSERHVSVRPAPDTMTYLTALLPVQEGVAAYAALDAAAASARAAGDPRSRGQVMADTLVERLRGSGAATPVEVCVVMTDAALLAGDDAPARITTTNPSSASSAAGLLPASAARDLVREAGRAFVRRLRADPASGQLVGMDSTRRVFDGNLRRMLILRDQTCRTPWCDAPIRHGDHVSPHAEGGVTSLENGQGLCERCNQTKSLPGWRAEVVRPARGDPDGRHVVRTTTPTGRTYDSTAPPLIAYGNRLAG